VLVGPVDRRVHAHRPVDRADPVGMRQQRRVDPVPRAVTGEPTMSLPHRLPRPEVLRQVPPGDPGPEPVHDALHDRAVITKLIAALAIRARHQRLDELPLGIRQHRRSRHSSTITVTHRSIWETRPSHPIKFSAPLRYFAGTPTSAVRPSRRPLYSQLVWVGRRSASRVTPPAWPALATGARPRRRRRGCA
jgi:hypothetical protein